MNWVGFDYATAVPTAVSRSAPDIRVAVIATYSLYGRLRQFLGALLSEHQPTDRPRHAPPYPGFKAAYGVGLSLVRAQGRPMGHYVIRVRGTLSRDLTESFPSLAADPEPARTVLHGYLADQAAPAGILNHLGMWPIVGAVLPQAMAIALSPVPMVCIVLVLLSRRPVRAGLIF